MRGSSFHVAPSRLKLRIESLGWSYLYKTPLVRVLLSRVESLIIYPHLPEFFLSTSLSLTLRFLLDFLDVSTSSTTCNTYNLYPTYKYHL